MMVSGQKVWIYVNSVIGQIPGFIVRKIEGEDAKFGNPMPGESVFEVRYATCQFRGRYTFAPQRDLSARA